MRAWATKGRFPLVGGIAVVLVLSAAACGGGGSNTTTSTKAGGTPPEQWASGVCSAVTTWMNSLQNIKTNVTSQPSKSTLQKAGQQIESATETLAQSLKQLGEPNTAQGQAAKQNLDTLATTVQTGANKIKQTLNSSESTLSQISAISTTLSAMANNLKIAGNNLKNFAPSGELQQAFHQAGACQPYVKS